MGETGEKPGQNAIFPLIPGGPPGKSSKEDSPRGANIEKGKKAWEWKKKKRENIKPSKITDRGVPVRNQGLKKRKGEFLKCYRV